MRRREPARRMLRTDRDHGRFGELAQGVADLASDLLHFTERGSGPPLLLVHGVMITGEMFQPVLDRLAARHRVIVPDLRGHGRSRRLPPPYTVAQLAVDLSRLLDHLGIDRPALGSS